MLFKKLRAGRAAVGTSNTLAAMERDIVLVYTQFLQQNSVQEKDIVAIHFSVTDDLTAANPASLLRKAGFAASLALFCSAEPQYEGAMRSIIRLLVYYYGRKKAVPVYLQGAERLRPDLFQGKSSLS